MQTSWLLLHPHTVVCSVPTRQRPLVKDPGEEVKERDVLTLPLARQTARGPFFNLSQTGNESGDRFPLPAPKTNDKTFPKQIL